ncbi:MAG: hypothetical protein AAGK79_15970 [Pseudomonadota bacterium]
MARTDIAPTYNDRSAQKPVPHSEPAGPIVPAKPENANAPLSSGVTPDAFEEWLPFLDHIDATLEQKKELIQALWQIVLAHIDLQWSAGQNSGGPNSGGQSPACGQMPELAQLISHIMVDCEGTEKTHPMEGADSPCSATAPDEKLPRKPNEKPRNKPMSKKETA